MWDAMLISKRGADFFSRVRTAFEALLCCTGTSYSEKQLVMVMKLFNASEIRKVNRDWVTELSLDPEIVSALTGVVSVY